MNLLKNKNFKYGSIAVALTVAVLAVILVFNLIVTTLSSSLGWYVDTSSAGLFRFSEKSLAMLDEIDGENNKITLHFFADENLLKSTTYGYYVLGLVGELLNRYDFITAEYHEDLNKDAFEIGNIFGNKYEKTFVDMYQNNKFSQSTVIIRNDTYELGENGEYLTDIHGNKRADHKIRVLSITDMYDANSYSFIADYFLTGNLVSVCNLSPTAYFLCGHGEMTTEEDGTYGDGEYLYDIFTTCGFTVKKLNLAQNDFSLDSIKPSIAVIFAPQSDYLQVELDRIRAFVSGGGNLMAFADGNYYKLDNLNFLLAEYGVTVAAGKFKSGLDASLGSKDFSFAAKRSEDSPVLSVIDQKEDKVAVSDCRVLRVDPAKGASPLLYAPDSATVYGSDGVMQGNEAVAAYSTAEGRGDVFVCGASSLASSLVYVSVYGNRDVLLSVLDAMGAEDVPLNLEIKPLANNSLNLTRSQSILWSVILVVVPTLLIAALGIFVNVRRKRS